MSQININRLVLAMETSCVFCDCICIYLFFLWRNSTTLAQAASFDISSSHTEHTHPVGFPWKINQHVAETTTYITHNNHGRQASISSARFEPAIPAIERLYTYALDRTATGICVCRALSIIDMNFTDQKLTHLLVPWSVWATELNDEQDERTRRALDIGRFKSNQCSKFSCHQ